MTRLVLEDGETVRLTLNLDDLGRRVAFERAFEDRPPCHLVADGLSGVGRGHGRIGDGAAGRLFRRAASGQDSEAKGESNGQHGVS
jgi:hypothetical protein